MSSNDNPIIDIIELDFKYVTGDEEEDVESEYVLKNINLQIERGSFTAILGRNGSGKSTLAKNVNGLLLPIHGDVLVNGWNTKSDEDIWNIRQTVGMVFQNPDNQIVSSVVEDDIAFGPENLGIDPKIIRQRVDRAINAVRMGPYKDKAPHMLSGGQKQRIAIAGVIAMKPDCIVFDEPTAMLDPQGRKEVMEIIHELNKEGITTVLITHFMEEAARADRLVIMDEGEIKLDGTPAEVFKYRDELIDMRLDVPMAVELKHRLKERGYDLPDYILDEKELVDYLCQLK